MVMGMAGAVASGAEQQRSDALASFGAEAKARLEAVMNEKSYRGRIAASDVTALMRTEHLTREALMIKLIPVAKSFAHPPLSNYYVGAVALGKSGDLYFGCNIEVPGNILGLAVHAEQAAIANAYMSNESGIEAIAVSAAPCGHCRQFLSEVSLDLGMRVMINEAREVKLSDLLPQAFGPKDLGFSQGSFPVRRAPAKPVKWQISATPPDALMAEAWKAAQNAYSPYTRSPSGVAIGTANGRVFAGSYIENAAFNPSLPPLETALAGYFAAGRNAGQIARVVLVEGERNSISQQMAARSALAVLAPGVQLERFG